MGRHAIGERAFTPAEKQARRRAKAAQELAALKATAVAARNNPATDLASGAVMPVLKPGESNVLWPSTTSGAGRCRPRNGLRNGLAAPPRCCSLAA